VPPEKPNDRVVARVFYDANCRFCVTAAHRLERILARRRIELAPLQSPGVSTWLGIPDDQLLAEMRFRLHDGTVFGGAAAVAGVARHIWWAWPLWAMSRLPGAMRPMNAVYQRVARSRNCVTGACAIDARQRLWPWGLLPLLILPLASLLAAPLMARWAFMWTMAFALYAGCKWLTYTQARMHVGDIDRRRVLGYLLAWPGMDAVAFLRGSGHIEHPPRIEWALAALKTILGIVLTWIVARGVLPVSPLAAGWLGMAGAIFTLHFGTFHLLSLVWRSMGINAMPVMRNPVRSCSLAEFWGRRWNTAFHELASRFTFRPLRPLVGSTWASLLVFVVSGLIHELVISLPARGGYGLPTGYFVLQGLGVAGERSSLGRRLGLGRGWRGWLFTVLATAGPAFWLFPPPFVRNVILPMLAVIGAI
jgi:predicted DCC family thiol-disulfide oxidoreductase YuxK